MIFESDFNLFGCLVQQVTSLYIYIYTHTHKALPSLIVLSPLNQDCIVKEEEEEEEGREIRYRKEWQ